MESLFFGGSLFENGADSEDKGGTITGTASGVADGVFLRAITAQAEEE